VVAAIVSISGAVAGLEYSFPVAPLTAVFFSVVFLVSVALSPKRRISFRKS